LPRVSTPPPPPTPPTGVLRDDLLDGVTVLAAPRSPLTDRCRALGAQVTALEADLLDDTATRDAADEAGPAQTLVVDAAVLFGTGGPELLRSALDATWSAVHAHFAPEKAGKVILVAPASHAGPHAQALRAGLENLARTLSIEWSRYGMRTTALLPGPDTTDQELAELVAFLASPAGEYYSGCAFTLT
jgi:NAD(P)-dependent dehydrogenase (short-subunit alcohol dehydrogenase family)